MVGRSGHILQQMVHQVPVAHDPLMDPAEHQTPMRLVEKVLPVRSSVEAAGVVLERSAKSGEDRPSGEQDLRAPSNLSCETRWRRATWESSRSSHSFFRKGALQLESLPSLVSNMMT